MKPVIQVLIIISILVKVVCSLRAYDCQHEDTALQAINLAEPAKCPDVDSDYDPPTEQLMQVLQTVEEIALTKAYRCKVQVTKEVTGCTKISSLTYGARYPLWEQVIKVTAENCRKAYETQKFNYEGKELDISLGIPSKFKYYSHGSLSSSGVCRFVDEVESEGVIYTNVYQHIRITILVEEVPGTYNLLERTVTFSTLGIRGRYDDRALYDWEEGTVMWPDNKETCEKGVSVVYRGQTWVHRKKSQAGEYKDAIVLINSTNTNQYAGLIVKDHVSYCGRSCYHTHITSLSLCKWDPSQTGGKNTLLNKDDLFKASIDTARVDIQTQMAHMHFTTNMAVADAFRQIQKAMCITDRKTLSNKLQAIAGESTAYALMDLYGPGYTSYIAGSVAYIAKCVPVEVTRGHFENCTHEIPASYRTELVFVNPITRIIQPYPTVLPCSAIMQVRWQLDEGWFCAGPETRKCEPPLTLEPLTPSKMEVDFTTGMGRGIYTDEQLAAHRRFDNAMTSRIPVVARIANQITDDGNNHQGHLGSILGTIDLQRVEDTLTPKWFPFVYHFGRTWHYITGVAYCYLLIMIMGGVLLRLHALYERRGRGWWLLGAITDTTFMIATLPVSAFRTIFTMARDVGNDPRPPTLGPRNREGRDGPASTQAATSAAQRDDEVIKPENEETPKAEKEANVVNKQELEMKAVPCPSPRVLNKPVTAPKPIFSRILTPDPPAYSHAINPVLLPMPDYPGHNTPTDELEGEYDQGSSILGFRPLRLTRPATMDYGITPNLNRILTAAGGTRLSMKGNLDDTSSTKNQCPSPAALTSFKSSNTAPRGKRAMVPTGLREQIRVCNEELANVEGMLALADAEGSKLDQPPPTPQH